MVPVISFRLGANKVEISTGVNFDLVRLQVLWCYRGLFRTNGDAWGTDMNQIYATSAGWALQRRMDWLSQVEDKSSAELEAIQSRSPPKSPEKPNKGRNTINRKDNVPYTSYKGLSEATVGAVTDIGQELICSIDFRELIVITMILHPMDRECINVYVSAPYN
ncbi:hypothetical protein FQA39_LY00157 [Lamprigera yunnana]|nr:hypothetical protein FQA39_LY00157 [Lamprigera yunnana]